MMRCPACRGTGQRHLQIAPTEGLCPDCEGAGSVAEKDQRAGAHGDGGWTFKYVPCRRCSGRGVLPIASGGTREGIVVISSTGTGSTPAGTNGNTPYAEYTDEDEVDEDTDSSSGSGGGDGSFFSTYRWYLIAGGGGLLVLLLIVSQLQKPKK